MRNRKGQSMLEYSILIMVIIAAIITMQVYIKRGVQGRWKASVDDLGEQYDPGKVNSVITYKTSGTSETLLTVDPVSTGVSGETRLQTMRQDRSSMTETKDGMTKVHY